MHLPLISKVIEFVATNVLPYMKDYSAVFSFGHVVSIAASEKFLYALTDDGEIWRFRHDKWEKAELPPLK